MWVADYVLMEYGTGAIMAVPAHDERDYDFATTFELPIRQVIDCGDEELPCSADGPLMNSAPEFDGLHNRDALEKIVDWLDDRGHGPPLGQLPAARLAALPPALLGLPDPDRPLPDRRPRPGARGGAAGRCCPTIEDYAPKGRSPLASAEDWVNVAVPALRRPGAARDRHDGHLRRLVVVLPALHGPEQRRGAVRPGRRSRAGCRSTSTSAASSTRSCT